MSDFGNNMYSEKKQRNVTGFKKEGHQKAQDELENIASNHAQSLGWESDLSEEISESPDANVSQRQSVFESDEISRKQDIAWNEDAGGVIDESELSASTPLQEDAKSIVRAENGKAKSGTNQAKNDTFSTKVIKFSEARKRKESLSNVKRKNSRFLSIRLSKQMRAVLSLLIIGCIVCVVTYFLQKNFWKMNDYSVEWSRDLDKGSFVGYQRFQRGLLKYSKDGATYLDKEGKEIWKVAYEMSNPYAFTNGDYVGIADKQTNHFILINKEGEAVKHDIQNPISRFELTQYGIVATLEEDIASSYIIFYDKDGKALAITIKTKMAGVGYPTDFAISPDSKLMMVGFSYIESGKLRSRIVFYDFSDASVSMDNRILAGFDEDFKDSLIGRVRFMNEKNAFAISSQGISFFKIIGNRPTLHKKYQMSQEIISVAHTKEYVAIVTQNNDNTKTLSVYNPSGSSVFSKTVDKNFTHLDIDGEYFFLYSDRECTIYNQLGVEKFSKTFDFDISMVSKTKELNKFILTGPTQMKCIKLK